MDHDHHSTANPAADFVTIAAIGLLTGALVALIHEGLGHGGACLLVGGKPTLLSTMNFVWDDKGFPRWALRAVSAGGTIANLLAGALALVWLRRPPSSVHLHYFLWLFAAINLYVGTGYLLYSGFSNIGDWANFFAGLPGYWLWRVLLVLVGGASYYLCVRTMLVKARPLTGGDPAVRYHRANLLKAYSLLWRCDNERDGRGIESASQGVDSHFSSRRFVGRHVRPGLGPSTSSRSAVAGLFRKAGGHPSPLGLDCYRRFGCSRVRRHYWLGH